MKKVMIIGSGGSGGSGKSTLAKTLGEYLNIPVYHLDALFWKPYRKNNKSMVKSS